MNCSMAITPTARPQRDEGHRGTALTRDDLIRGALRRFWPATASFIARRGYYARSAWPDAGRTCWEIYLRPARRCPLVPTGTNPLATTVVISRRRNRRALCAETDSRRKTRFLSATGRNQVLRAAGL